MLSEQRAMEELDKSVFRTSTAGCGSASGGLVDSPSSCLSSGYCSDDAASGHDDVFFGRHGKDCWMSSADVDTVDLLRCSLPSFDADLSSTASAAAAAVCHDSVVDKFDDIVDNWLFNSMSVPSPCVDSDWPLPPSSASAPSASASEGLEDLPKDSVLADLLLNQFAYTAASTHLARPEVQIDHPMPSAAAEPSRKPETMTTSAGACQTEATSGISATKRTLDAESCESSAARRRRSSPCRGCCSNLPEVTSPSAFGSTTTSKSHRAAAVCCDCSTESARRSPGSACAPSSTEVDLSRLSALRPEWPGFADLVVGKAASPLELSSDSVSKTTESPTESRDVEDSESDAASLSAESSRTVTSRPVILEALLRSSNRLDANRGSSGALVQICLVVVSPLGVQWGGQGVWGGRFCNGVGQSRQRKSGRVGCW